MNFHQSILLDVLVGFAIMEAVVKPITVRAMQYLMRWADSHVKWIPDWLYRPLNNQD